MKSGSYKINVEGQVKWESGREVNAVGSNRAAFTESSNFAQRLRHYTSALPRNGPWSVAWRAWSEHEAPSRLRILGIFLAYFNLQEFASIAEYAPLIVKSLAGTLRKFLEQLRHDPRDVSYQFGCHTLCVPTAALSVTQNRIRWWSLT
jgi:hypothetical protein